MATKRKRPQACARLKRLEREVEELREIVSATVRPLDGTQTVQEQIQKPAEVDAFGEPIRRGADGKRIATAMDDAFLFPDEQIALNITQDDGKGVTS